MPALDPIAMEPDQKPAAPDSSPADAQGADYNGDEGASSAGLLLARSQTQTLSFRFMAYFKRAEFWHRTGLAAQRVEARIGCKILNTMTALGMPDSEMIG